MCHHNSAEASRNFPPHLSGHPYPESRDGLVPHPNHEVGEVASGVEGSAPQRLPNAAKHDELEGNDGLGGGGGRVLEERCLLIIIIIIINHQSSSHIHT